MVIIFTNCKQQSKKVTFIENKVMKEEVIDSIAILKKLLVKTPSNVVEYNKGKKFLLPFNYKLSSYKGNVTHIFKWNLCDLIIDSSDSINYSYFGLKDNIPYDGYGGFEGNIHFVNSLNSTAITTEKFINSEKEHYDKIYYSDDESIIFKKGKGVHILQFRYLNDEKKFSIYYNENLFIEINYEYTQQERLDLAIAQLRFAKNLYKERTEPDLFHWGSYKGSLSLLHRKRFKFIHNNIVNSVDTLKIGVTFSPKEWTKTLVSIMRLNEEGNKLWNAINTISEDRVIDFSTIYNTDISDQIAFLRVDNSIQLEYKNGSTVILKKENDSKKYDYAVFNKQKINNKDVLMFTGGYYDYGFVNSKKMAYFYLNLFENYTDIL